MDKLEALKRYGHKSRYTIGELADAAGCAENTVRRHVGEGLVYSFKIGGRRYIPMETAIAYLTGQKCDQVPSIDETQSLTRLRRQIA